MSVLMLAVLFRRFVLCLGAFLLKVLDETWMPRGVRLVHAGLGFDDLSVLESYKTCSPTSQLPTASSAQVA